MNYEDLMSKARSTNANRDESERKSGYPAESDLPPSMQLRTAMMAIEAGIKLEDWGCVAEAQAMLENIARLMEADNGKRLN